MPAKKTTLKSNKKASSISAPKKTAKDVKSTKLVTPKQTNTYSKPQVSERVKKITSFLGKNVKKPKVYVPLVVIVLLALTVVFKSLFVVALVDGKPVFRQQYQQELEAQAGKQVMNSLVTESLLEQEASRRHITVSQSELDVQLKTIEDQLAKQGQTLDTALAAQGLSKDSFMQQLKLQTLVQKMLADKTQVTNAEIDDYINKNQSSLPTGESQDQIKAQVKQQLQQQKLSQEAQSLIQQLEAKAHITYFINL